jgi:hypothetical protein
MIITDTSPAVQSVQFEIQRGMTGEKRVLIALEMSLFARDLATDRIRREHPTWSETQVTRELLRLAFLPKPIPVWLSRRFPSR